MKLMRFEINTDKDQPRWSVSLRVLCQHKLTYFLMPIKGIEEYLVDPLGETIRITFMPAISGGHQIIEGERNLLSLPP